MRRTMITAVLTVLSVCSQLLIHCEHQHSEGYFPLRKNGISGLAQIDSCTYLAVHDYKSFEEGLRLTLIRTNFDDDVTYIPITVDGWTSSTTRASDLESICPIPGKKGEFLAAESSQYQNDHGFIYHLKLNVKNRSAAIEGNPIAIPFQSINSSGSSEDNFEGMECDSLGGNDYLVFLGERGGSDTFPNGKIRWFTIDLNQYSVTSPAQSIDIDAPGHWMDKTKNRDISGLFIEGNELWATASEDMGDNGIFYSVLYKIGTVNPKNDPPFTTGNFDIWTEVSGFKIEGLSGPTHHADSCFLSIGTEDEVYGGAWRPVKKPTKKLDQAKESESK